MKNLLFNNKTEESVLKISIAGTVTLGAIGIAMGLLARSSAILFDSVYEMIDAVMTLFALLVARLIAASNSGDLVNSKLEERFTMGFWHLEPIVLGVSGAMLMSASIYALINAVDSFLSGGREIIFTYAITFMFISFAIEFSLGNYAKIANKQIKSEFLALDSKAWLISSSMSVAYLAAFIFGYFAEGTKLQWMTPYIDPAILTVVCIVVIPIPFSTVKRAFADILLVTPLELKQHVDSVARDVTAKYGFDSYRAYVARVGRGRQIEIYFIVPKSWPPRCLEEWDRLRDEISAEIDGESPDLWLTIVFTTDREWAE